ncbi:hypothetical protein [Microvirga sp. VF16]|uniref:hypothetical protein n=1 Tax=Microvirga sp. VF16 TaxID=2807101 RepID=UPI00193E2064|nr:hypothetical protein [Microvirga sp. VF16]QRM35626.1 hypothetical protein JO965_43145 [Microvirga sp. VF16]
MGNKTAPEGAVWCGVSLPLGPLALGQNHLAVGSGTKLPSHHAGACPLQIVRRGRSRSPGPARVVVADEDRPVGILAHAIGRALDWTHDSTTG